MNDSSLTHPEIRVSKVLQSPAIHWRSDECRQLRVLHVITFLGQGGTEQVVLNLVKGLGHGLFEQQICTTRGYDSQFASKQGLAGRLSSAGSSGTTFQFPLFRLAKIMRTYRPHIVHTRNWGALEAVPAARLAGVPVVIHSEHGYEMENLSGLPARRRLFRRFAYGMTDAVFSVSNELRHYHARQAWLPLDQIRVIYNGVDIHRFAPRPEVREQLRRQFGWNAGQLVIGTVGRVVPIKDQATLLRSADGLIASGIDAHVLLVGAGPELERLRNEVAAHLRLAGRVHFAGASDHVDELLNAMDVYVLPSLKEGMSNTLLEAMATGLPVIATRVGGNSEIVEDGRCGWLFPPKDVAALTERLMDLANDPRSRQAAGGAARQRILDTFSIERMIANYRGLYLETATMKGLKIAGEETT
jgi:sugar transferase (PEP-CTERM/EpsH1 system associated)